MSKEIKTVLAFAGVFVLLAMVAIYFVIDTMDKRDALDTEIADLEGEIQGMEKVKGEIGGREAEQLKLTENLKHYVQILPSPDVFDEEALMTVIQRNANATNFVILEYTINRKVLREQEKKKSGKGGKKKKKKKKGKKGGGAEEEAFTEIAVKLTGVGTWQQFLNFMNSIESNQTFLKVNDFTVVAPDNPIVDEDNNERWPLTCDINISTYQYDVTTPAAGKGKKKKKK